MASPDPHFRRQYKDLHPKDQQIKQTKRLCIEKNWDCAIEECLPEAIRPRIELKRGAKARVGEDVGAEAWWNWSVELLKALEELSSMTVNELSYAQELLSIEVQHRQQNPKSAQRKIMEVLLGDAQRVVEEQRKRVANAYEGEALNEDEDMGMGFHGGHAMLEQQAMTGDDLVDEQRRAIMDGDEYLAGLNEEDFAAMSEHNDYVDQGNTFEPAAVPRSSFRHNTGAAAHFQTNRSRRTVLDQLKTTELMARASRLRAEAARAEAEAVQLEVKAKLLHEELEGLE